MPVLGHIHSKQLLDLLMLTSMLRPFCAHCSAFGCRAVPEPDAINCLCGTVKLQSAGLLKMKQAGKKGKK